MRATGKRCRRCRGNVITSYEKGGGQRSRCLQCGRDPKFARPILKSKLSLDQQLSRALRAGGLCHA